MKPSVFDFQNYKTYLLKWIDSRPGNGRGERSRMSETLHCQLAYVSQVLNGSAHFSFEQAEALNRFMGHDDEESDFFLLLLHHDRAGSADLRKRIRRKIDQTLDHRLLLKNRIVHDKKLSLKDQMTYYSAWYFSAVHLAIAIPNLRNREAISEALRIPLRLASRALDFLAGSGLIRESKGNYEIENTRIHLGSDSPLISKHHTNWRMEAVKSLEREDPTELHYSSVITIAEKDFMQVREALVKAIENVRAIVRPSQDEKLCCYTIDLFRITE